MSARSISIGLALIIGLLGLACLTGGFDNNAPVVAQPPLPQEPIPAQQPYPAQIPVPAQQPALLQQADPQNNVEVLGRGPVHEAFASLSAETSPSTSVSKQPPKPLDEQPPEEKPEGNVTWIGGYWAWDDERNDYLWVSGTWRTPPPGKQWVAGYWSEDNATSKWQWVPGFWTTAPKENAPPQQTAYLAPPPAVPPQAPPGQPPAEESFWVPGHWTWDGARYVWSAGYWARVQPGYVWMPAHYAWTPGGYMYVPGYWDLTIKQRGLLYAPVVVRPGVVVVSYTPAYAVPDALVVDTLFVRPVYAHYYFGDYYGPAYRGWGYESAYVYSGAHYDSIIVYERYEHRRDPAWFTVQINLYNDRFAGRAPLPPRVFVPGAVVVRGGYPGPRLAPAREIAAAKGMRTVHLERAERENIRARSMAAKEVAAQRVRNDVHAREAAVRAANTTRRPAPPPTHRPTGRDPREHDREEHR